MKTFAGATLDSRLVRPGMLFVAVKGERVDGHDYIPQALERGAAGIIDGREELARVARDYRCTLKATVIGVTGSAGKTTTKELVAAFLRAGGLKVHATEGNYNNDLGLPLTILNCPVDADVLVVEMGTNHPGEIRHLVDVAAPDIGLISSIGTAHIEFFKTQDGIADEKGALFAGLSGSAVHPSFAVLARENARYDRLTARCRVPLVTVSLTDPAAARLAEALRLRLPGRHNVSNALIALACATRLGVAEDTCFGALADFTLPGGRWRVVEREGVVYVDDTYNANPTSMIAALETFAALDVKGRRIAVIGDMFELGEQSAAFHDQVKARATVLPLDRVILVGANMGGMDRAAAKAELARFVRPGDAVLLKASHGMHLDELLK
ncbi:MAG: UDP-N-acetylmuramoyl-tripeptide--D-alanyl-D-alanine ligase [Kiritimatiellia bacterium]